MKEVLVPGRWLHRKNIIQFLVDRGDCIVTAADIKQAQTLKYLTIKKNPNVSGCH